MRSDRTFVEAVLDVELSDSSGVGVFTRFLNKKVHESAASAHMSAQKLLQRLEKVVYWVSMRRDIPEWTRACLKCKLCAARPRMIPALQPVVANRPMEHVGIDLLDLGTSANGYRYALTIIDSYTKLGGAYPLKTKRADEVARVFIDRWMLESGRLPTLLMSDNGVYRKTEKQGLNNPKLVIDWKGPYHVKAVTDTTAVIEDADGEFKCSLIDCELLRRLKTRRQLRSQQTQMRILLPTRNRTVGDDYGMTRL